MVNPYFNYLYVIKTEAALGWFPGAWATPEKKEKKKFRFSTENGFESHTLHM